ncbi:major facilitator superfamily transporter [Colletotrichum karsti]|uniref:Major facilitator superfamily transporter n=1 Tax=Colletotrichum karsti TaxID=1095194 RepID=A0A9P6LF99_9PEZI|nr:major facilitator superfamily transporter [Colletotrichum karsti]KAF9873929.1 major facilitator superfamily transporter [Colletotrichum karsti]
MSSVPSESPHGREEKDAARDAVAADNSVVVNNSTNDSSPPTSSSQTSPPVEKAAAPAGPPNGGLQAWLHILGSFLLYFNTWGLISSFGAFQAYYQSELLSSNSSFQISTIGSLQNFLMVFLGFIIGPIYDLGYSRYLLITGSLLVLAGLILQAFCRNLWQFLLCQGLIIGIGTGCLSTLGVALPSQWFSTRLPLANGIAANGSGVGGLVLPALFRALQPKIGFRWTVLVFALISLVTLGISLFVIKTSSLKTPPKRRPWIDRSVFTDLPFLLFLGACCLLFLGMYTPYVYVQSYALENKMASENVALYLLSILNGASIVGRIVPNFIVPYTGIMNMIASAVFAMSIAAFCFAATNSQGSLIAVTVVYGFFAGTFFALQPTTFVKLTADKSYMGTRFGMAFTVMSVAILFGSPIAGALSRSFGYLSGWIWAGCCLAASGLTIFTARGVSGGWKVNKAMSIKTVAVVGASGLVGLRVVRALQEHGFNVTAISRESSTAKFPGGVAVRKADLSSVESLTKALAGQDAVVSAISTVAAVVHGSQDPLIDASVAAGVKRFIPSEYGLNTRNLKGEILGDWLIAKTAAVDYLIKKAEANPSFTWTGIGTSLFFDWSITRGIYGIDLEKKHIDIFDSGTQKVSTTSLVFLAEGIAAVLKHPDEVANQYINIIEFDVTQNQLLKLFEAETGTKWTVNHKTADEVNEEGKKKLAAGGRFPFEEFLIEYHFADKPGHSIPEEGKANKVLQLPQSDLREFVKGYIKENSK